MPMRMQIKADDVNVFLRGGGALDINSVRKKPKVLCNDVCALYHS